MNIKIKIAIPIILVVLIAIAVMFVSSNSVKKFVEIDSNANVLLKINGGGKIVKVIPFDSNAETVLAGINVEEKDPLAFTKSYIEKATELEYLTVYEEVNLLVASSNLEKDKQFISDLSSLLSTECTNKVNQYKVTKDDYQVINGIKANAKYTSFEIIDQGFTSKESAPYITSVIYNNGSYYINFSKEVVFNGNEKVVCYALGEEYPTTPAGYNKNAMAVLVEDAPLNTTLVFDVSIKDYDNLEGLCITPSDGEVQDPNKDVEVDVSIDNEINQEKLDSIHSEIESADITDKERSDLLRQYEILQGSINNLSTDEEINDFNIMYTNLVDSLEALTEEDTAPTQTPAPVATKAPTATTAPAPAPTATPAPTPTPTQTDFKTLNNNYYNQLNQYKAIVLSIQDANQRNTINAEINQLYYKLSIATTQEDYDNFASGLATFEEHLRPYMQ